MMECALCGYVGPTVFEFPFAAQHACRYEVVEKLIGLMSQFESEVQVVVAEVTDKEREYLDMQKFCNARESIEHTVDRTARYGLGKDGRR